MTSQADSEDGIPRKDESQTSPAVVKIDETSHVSTERTVQPAAAGTEGRPQVDGKGNGPSRHDAS